MKKKKSFWYTLIRITYTDYLSSYLRHKLVYYYKKKVDSKHPKLK